MIRLKKLSFGVLQKKLQSREKACKSFKAGSQYDATRAMRGVKHACERRNRLGFYSCISCVHVLRQYCEPGFKAGSQYDATRAMWGVKRARERRNRLGFYSCVSCVHALRRIVNRALVLIRAIASYTPASMGNPL